MKTAQEFYNYFAPIPEEQWAQGAMTKYVDNKECHCSMGHLGARNFGYHEDENEVREGFKQEEVIQNIISLALILDEDKVNEFAGAKGPIAEHVIYKINDDGRDSLDDSRKDPYIYLQNGKRAKRNILKALMDKGAKPYENATGVL